MLASLKAFQVCWNPGIGLRDLAELLEGAIHNVSAGRDPGWTERQIAERVDQHTGIGAEWMHQLQTLAGQAKQ